MSTLLGITDLSLDIAGPILRDVSMEVKQGCIVGMIGESGAGKSMLGRAVLGLLPVGSRVLGGSVVFDGRDITHLPERERRKLLGKDMALIPQNPMSALNPVTRIRPQIEDVLRMHLGLSGARVTRRTEELLEAVQLDDGPRILRSYPYELSGGMLQRILIAIAFACQPRLVIADEPTTALDMITQKEILRLIRNLQRREGCAVLFISHDLGVVAKLCDEVSVMCAGSMVENAPVERLFAAPSHPYTRGLLAAAKESMADGIA